MVALHLVLRPTPNGLGIVLKNLSSSLPSPPHNSFAEEAATKRRRSRGGGVGEEETQMTMTREFAPTQIAYTFVASTGTRLS